MATRFFDAQWVDVYNKSGGWSKVRGSTPYQIGGSSEYHVFARIPDAVKTALNTSSTSPSLHMVVNFTSGSNDIDIGHHRERNARSVGASGLPWYAYNETWRNGGGTGQKIYQMSGWFMPQFLSGNIQGIVMYSFGGAHYASANSIQFRVTGTWNTAPTNPTNVRVYKNVADISQTLRWNASTDAEGDSLTYDIGFYNGLRWATIATGVRGTTYTRNTSNDRETIVGDSARFRVRAYDGELYSGWVNSPYWQVEHVPPSFNANQVSYQDINSTTVGITGNNQDIIQNVSIPRAFVNSGASANDGKSIRRYIFSLGGQERTRNTIGSVDFSPVDAENNLILRVTAEDNYGLRTTVSKTVNIIPYEVPEVQYRAQRVGSIADETVLEVSGSISPLDGKNSLQTTRYRYRQTGGNYTTWRTLNRSVSGNNFTASNVHLNLPSDEEWEIQINVIDRVSGVNEYVRVRRGQPVMFLDELNDRMGIGKYPTRGALDARGYIFLDGFLSIGHEDSPTSEIRMVSSTPGYGNAGIEITSNKSYGTTYIDFNTRRNSSDSGLGDVRIQASDGNSSQHGEGLLTFFAGDVNFRGNGEVQINGDEIASRGGGYSEGYIRLYNGFQVVWTRFFRVEYVNANTMLNTWVFPASFADEPVVVPAKRGTYVRTNLNDIAPQADRLETTKVRLKLSSSNSIVNPGDTMEMDVIAVGRWK